MNAYIRSVDLEDGDTVHGVGRRVEYNGGGHAGVAGGGSGEKRSGDIELLRVCGVIRPGVTDGT